jgi:Domain of unknown function (DUF4365)
MKQWTERETTARSGIVKLDRVVTDMGYIWRPTPNSDVGIDGEIELVEDRAATAKIIKAQVKSGPSYFRKEDQSSFELHASIDDVKYWLAANNPVIIAVYHPERDSLYAIHVQAYAQAHAEISETGLFKFDKAETILLAEHGHKLKAVVFGVATPTRLAISAKRREKLRSNLLPVIENIEFLYSLPTLCRDKQEVRFALAALPKPPFIVKENRIWTCSYLPGQDCALRTACNDSEEVRITPAIEWLEDPAKELWLVELFNSCLQKYCARLGLVYDFKHKRFYCPPKDRKEWWFSYQSVQQAARRRPAYPSISRVSGRVRFWVHQSARFRFERLGPTWFLKIIPGYVFTEDGYKFLTASEVGRVTTGKKARERNLVVLRTLMFWRDFLSSGDGVITIFPGSQKLVLSKDYLDCLTEFGIEGDGLDLSAAALAEEDDLDIEQLLQNGQTE